VPNVLFVGGWFDKKGGHPSRIVRKLAYGLYETINGGTIQDLEEVLDTVHRYDAVVWMPHISNSETKLLPRIKENAPRIVLISSKRNDRRKYEFEHVIDRALKSKSQLLIEIRDSPLSNTARCYDLRLVDPLGNVSEWFTTGRINEQGEEEIAEFRCLLYERIQFLLRMKRVKSVCSALQPLEKARLDRRFMKAIQKYADRFHELIHGDNENPRFMGNASFRCTKGGFPSQRTEHAIYVSRRNVDKRCLDSDGFVAVDNTLEHSRMMRRSPSHLRKEISEQSVMYWGENKPSVDTPVQVELYRLFPNINFMLHAHVYHKDGVMTARYVPCGDLREVDEVVNAIGDPEAKRFIVNLKGHGCILASENVEDLLDQEPNFRARPTEEKTL